MNNESTQIIVNMIMSKEMLQLVTGIIIGAAAGYLGSFMILRRMALVGDALSHVALPGVALALLYNFNPIAGAFAALLVGTIIIWLLEKKSHLPTESLVGLMFTVALSIGLLITPREDILDALIGDISSLSRLDALLGIVLAIIIVVVMSSIANQFILATVSSDLAKASGVKVARNNFIFLLLVALIVALGIKVVGTLLMGALVVIPAIASRNISTGKNAYIIISTVIGLLSVLIGMFIAQAFSYPPGPMIVLASTAIFLLSLGFKK